jgi:hypothetical protein
MTAAHGLLLTPLELERLVEKLPAEPRARLRWAPERLRRRLDRMLEDTREEAALAVAAECVHDCLPLLDSVESVAGEKGPTLDDQLPRLVEYFQGGAPVRAAEWVCHALAVAWSKEQVVAEWRQALRRAAQGGAEPGEWSESALFHLLRGYVMFLALLRAAERGIAQEQMGDFARLACLEAVRGVKLYAEQGVELDPLSRFTPEERIEKLLKYADDLMDELTAEDLEVLRAAQRRPL